MNYNRIYFLVSLWGLLCACAPLQAAETLECLSGAKVQFWAKGDAYLNGVKQVDRANCYTESDLADSLKVLYNQPDAVVSNIKDENGNSLTEFFNYGGYKTPQTILYTLKVNGQTLNGCRVSVSVLDKLPPYCNDNDANNNKFKLTIDADPVTCKASAEQVDAELAKCVSSASSYAINDKIWYKSKTGSSKSVSGSGIASIVGNWEAMALEGKPTEFEVSDVPYTIYYKVSDAAGNTRERTAYDGAVVDGVYPYCYATITVRKPAPVCGNPTINLTATASKCRYDADEVFAELQQMETAGYACGEALQLEQVTHDTYYRYGVVGNFVYKVNSVQCVAKVAINTAKVDCPALSLKKVYDKKGLCNAAIADTAALYLKKALQKISDCRINAEYCYIPDGGVGDPVIENGTATYRFNYLLVDANNKVLDDACEATMVVADAFKPSCPSSSLNLVVPVGTDCIAIADEAVDFFENKVPDEGKGKKSSCSGATLFAGISAFKYVDESTKDEKIGGIIDDMRYDFNWTTSVPLLYRIASNAEFVNPNYCTAYIYVKDDAEIRCPSNTDVKIATASNGVASFPLVKVIAPVACRPSAVSASYTLKNEDGEERELSLSELADLRLSAGTYQLSVLYSRVAAEYQTASQKTCVQVIEVADATAPDCPTISATGVSLQNKLCALDIEGVKQLIETEIGTDRRLDNKSSNAELTVAAVVGDAEIAATKNELPHVYSFQLSDAAGNESECSASVVMVDTEAPSCPEVRSVELTLTDTCLASVEIPVSGSDNCGIAAINWWCDDKQKTAYEGSECYAKIEGLSLGSHTLYWQLQDKAGNWQNDGASFCSQTINVYGRFPIAIDCDTESKHFSTSDNCKMVGVLDSLPLLNAAVLACADGEMISVPASQYLLNGVAVTLEELNGMMLDMGDYELTTVFSRAADGYLLESQNQCTQPFTVEDKSKLTFNNPLSLSAVELVDAASLSVRVSVAKSAVVSCEPVLYNYKIGNGFFEELHGDYIVANIQEGETLVTLKAESGKRAVETDLKIVLADTSVSACDRYAWCGTDYDKSQDVVLEIGSNTERVDTIKVLRLTINQSKSAEFSASACDAYVWNGLTYTESGDFEQMLRTKSGCDSVVTLHLTINPSYKVDTFAVSCDAFDWYGTKYEVSGEYSRTFATVGGCDSVVTLHLTIYPSFQVDTFAVSCDAFDWYGTMYETSGEYSRTFVTVGGCDSVVTLYLTINPSYQVDTFAVACDAFGWYGTKYEVSGDYSRTFTTVGGCDSVVTLHLTINPSYKVDTFAVACDAFDWYGTKYETSGDYSRTFTTVGGCDSVVTLHLTITPSYRVDTFAVSCDAFEWYGTIYETSGDYSRTFTTIGGCDSVVTLHLTINPSFRVDTFAVACDAFEWYGTIYETSGDYSRTFTTIGGCDSVVTLHLTITPSYRVDTFAVACDAFEWYGTKYETSGEYNRTFTTVGGCDSVVTLHLTINPSYRVDTFAVACDAFDWYGTKYEVSGEYSRTFTTIGGCDSVVTLHLTITPSYRVDTFAVSCDAFEWYGTKYETSGDYSRTFTTIGGCDSVVTLHLTITPSYRVDTFAVACDAFEWYGTNYEASGDYSRTFTTVGGCDSVVTLHLTIHPSYRVDTFAVACDAFEWYGTKYEASGEYSRTFATVGGCDSVVTLHLTINPSYKVDTFAVACDAFEWYGTKYETSGDYSRTFATIGGCDSLVTLHLTIHPSYQVDTFAVACDAFEWYGAIYEASGDYSRTFTTVGGCDSVVTLHLAVNNAVRDTVQITTCGSYTWHNKDYGVSGVYEFVGKSACGCDSVEVLVLTVNQPALQPVFVYGCDNLYWRGQMYAENADISDTLLSVSGCDSIVNYHLRVNKSVTTSEYVVACDEYEWRGLLYSESGLYTDTLQTVYGCDSILALHLTINHSSAVEMEAVACDSFLWEGAYYNESGHYEKRLTSGTGCDSLVVLHLTIKSSVSTHEQTSACGSFVWHGMEIAESGVYYDTLQTVDGCDSLVVLEARVGYPSSVVYSDSVLAGNDYNRYGFIISHTAIGHVANYTFHRDLKSWVGCDSVVTLNLKVYKNPDIRVDAVSVAHLGNAMLKSFCAGDTAVVNFNLLSGTVDSFSISFSPKLLLAGYTATSSPLGEKQPCFVIPAEAPAGRFVAYLTLYNQNDQSEQMEVPFKVGLPNTLIERMWNDVVVCNRKGQDFVEYQWYKGGAMVDGASRQYYQDFETAVGTYGLTVWNSDGQQFDVCPRTFEELEVPYRFVVSPNPVKTGEVFEVLVRGVGASELASARIYVYNASGVLVNTVSVVGEKNKLVLGNSGTYTVILSLNGGNVATSKVLVRP